MPSLGFGPAEAGLDDRHPQRGSAPAHDILKGEQCRIIADHQARMTFFLALALTTDQVGDHRVDVLAMVCAAMRLPADLIEVADARTGLGFGRVLAVDQVDDHTLAIVLERNEIRALACAVIVDYHIPLCERDQSLRRAGLDGRRVALRALRLALDVDPLPT